MSEPTSPEAEWAPEALAQLNEILEFIAIDQDRPGVARKLADDIQEKVAKYATQPEMGTSRFDLRPQLRYFSHK
ncbi:MAG: hypothetical protein CMJ46_16000 [Planctomyces sp.]|nr:hypothetical protein [Planctomyces sp.]